MLGTARYNPPNCASPLEGEAQPRQAGAGLPGATISASSGPELGNHGAGAKKMEKPPAGVQRHAMPYPQGHTKQQRELLACFAILDQLSLTSIIPPCLLLLTAPIAAAPLAIRDCTKPGAAFGTNI